ncbi:MAG: diguanylate cyclase [Gammaproteobacteria bacterium]|nr:diguanylate cyclase [Gammaproteobacteria bacterium]NVK89004.1 diguanylate cyclase [Gammaproteobacteria bacterium]
MLKTVSVPDKFAPIFERAEKQVREFFNQQRMAPEQGTIEVHDARYVLVRGAAFSVEFFQIIRKVFGDDNQQQADAFAAGLLYELAHAVGQSDARNFHQTMGLTDPIERLSAGPIHFAHTGWAFVDILPESNPTPDEQFMLVYRHPFSFECDAWLEANAAVEHPVCVMNAGYSSGWCQESFGIPLEAREVTCRSQGDEHCLFIMAQPHCLDDKIQSFAIQNPALEINNQRVDFRHLADISDNQPADWHQGLQQRLMAYARNLEATQAQLSANVERLEREVEERKRIERELKASEERWRELSEATFDAIIILVNQHVVDLNNASEQLFKRSADAIKQTPLTELFGQTQAEAIGQAMERGESQLEAIQLLQEGQETIVDMQLHHTQVNGSAATILAIRDVTERTRAMQRLERLANYDALTGLPNRNRFQRIVNRSIMGSNFSDKHGILFLDLDNFKSINDNFGHSAGDLLLFALATRMSEAIRGNNIICRLGGDEFAIWVPNLAVEEDAEQVARQIVQALKEPFEIQRQRHRVTFSIGIAIYPHDGTDYATLSRHSDTAMYQAKRNGKNRWCAYSDVKR